MSRRNPPGFWSLWTAVALDLVGFGIVIPILPLYAERFGAGPATIGVLFASYSLAQLALAPVWGRISDRLGRRPVLMITIGGSAVGSLLVGLASSLPILFAARILDGASGASIAVARAAVADVSDRQARPRLMGLLGAAFGLGFVVGPALGSLASLAGPSTPFFVAAAISAANLVAAYIRLPETRPAAAVESTSRLSRPMGPVARLALVSFVAITAFSGFEATFGLLGERRLGMDEASVAAVFAGVGLILVLTQGGLVGPAARWLGEVGLIRLGLVLDTAGFVVLAVADNWPLLLGGLGLLALGQGMLTPALSSSVAAASTDDALGVSMGWLQSAGGLARVVGPLIGGGLFAVTSAAPYVAAAVLTATAVYLVANSARLTSVGPVQP